MDGRRGWGWGGSKEENGCVCDSERKREKKKKEKKSQTLTRIVSGIISSAEFKEKHVERFRHNQTFLCLSLADTDNWRWNVKA